MGGGRAESRGRELDLPTYGHEAKPMTEEDFLVLEENSEWFGVTRLSMMENAGAAVARAARGLLEDVRDKRVVVFSGRGNNGGDGVVAARHLAALGAQVQVLFVGGEPASKEALRNYEILKKCPLSLNWKVLRDKEEIPSPTSLRPDLVVDAVLGTGVRGAPRGVVGPAIDLINEIDAPVISVDTPSGLNPFTADVPGKVVKADVTITFHAPKPGLSPELCGRVIVEDVGAPPESLLIAGPGDVRVLVKERPKWVHKGDFGKVLVVGGSSEYSGAPALVAVSALKSGADLATVMAPKSAAVAIKSLSPDLICSPLGSERSLSPEDLPRILEGVERSDVVVVGPGLGRDETTKRALTSLFNSLRALDKKTVADADALKALTPDMGWQNLIVTPHAGEFKAIFKAEAPTDLEKRIKETVRASSSLNGTILLKGHVDVIANVSRWKINVTGNPGMTVGGTGDVLSGVTATMFCLHSDPVRVAASSAYVTGRAGDLAYQDLSYGLTASDVTSHIPRVLKGVLSRGQVTAG